MSRGTLRALVLWGVNTVTYFTVKRPERSAPRWILLRPRLDPKALQNVRNLKSLDTTFGCQDDDGKSLHCLGLETALQGTIGSRKLLTPRPSNRSERETSLSRPSRKQPSR